jgi:putative oxidoreductase
MKHVPTIARILLGLAFTGAAIAGLMGKAPPPEPEAAKVFMGAVVGSGLIYVVKVLELLSGLALLSGFFVPLALAVLAPIIVNIAFFHFVLDPSGIVPAVVLIVLWAAVVKGSQEAFKPLLQMKS